jgi:hypothetical protein
VPVRKAAGSFSLGARLPEEFRIAGRPDLG